MSGDLHFKSFNLAQLALGHENGSFQKGSALPQRKFLQCGGGGEKKLFLIIVSVLARTSEGGRRVNFQFAPWGRYGCFLA